VSASARVVLALWLVGLAACATIAFNTPVTADLTAFLPPAATRSQQLLVEQLRSGVAARLVLVAIEGQDTPALAQTSRALADKLRASGFFSYVNNGDAAFSSAEREIVLRYRYLLSPAVVPGHFSAARLRQALETDLQLLASPVGTLIKSNLGADPSGELPRILSASFLDAAPHSRHGVWFSADGGKALLVAQTRAAGFDVTAQNEALSALRKAYEETRPPPGLRLLVTGPGVFAAESRAIIERDSWRLSLVAVVLVLAILFFVYRSFTVVTLGMLPVASGLLAGVALVGLGFGAVHGITLGFAATLIGEAVDYPSYLFTHVAPGEKVSDTVKRLWPTLRLAVLTTVFGGLTMLLSSFTGLSQLGLLSMTGVLVAGLVTRWVLPTLAPADFAPRQAVPVAWLDALRTSRALVWGTALALCAALALLAARHATLWDDDLGNLSPISESSKLLDKELRAELGAPDVRHLVVVIGKEREQALEKSEQVAEKLRALAATQTIAGFELAAQYLPSKKTQAARRAALPNVAELENNLARALSGLPFRAGLFVPFLRDVERARDGGLIGAEELRGTALALKVQSLLVPSGGEWLALIPLRGVEDETRLASEFAPLSEPDVLLLDLKNESSRMVNGYRNQSLKLTALGMLAIALVLAWGLRRMSLVWRVMRPVLAALVITVALLLLIGERLSLFHLVSLLLVLGIGVNYALFFNRAWTDELERRRTHLALLVCSLTSLSAFGTLAFSQTPVLHAIGLTVSLGVLLSLFASAALAVNTAESAGA
jgi:predicted exporter